MSESLDEKITRLVKSGELSALNIGTFQNGEIFSVTYRKYSTASTNIKQCKPPHLVETLHAILDAPYPLIDGRDESDYSKVAGYVKPAVRDDDDLI